MSQNTANKVAISSGVTALVALVSVTLLAWRGVIDGGLAIGAIMAILGTASGTLPVMATRVPTNASTQSDSHTGK